ncbi:MAG: hypothetical protein AAB728_05580, partial [Patescibacteria group bacterium]
HPRPGPPVQWLQACAVAVFMGSWCHVRTWGARHIDWRGFRYRTTWGGRVTGIQRTADGGNPQSG